MGGNSEHNALTTVKLEIPSERHLPHPFALTTIANIGPNLSLAMANHHIQEAPGTVVTQTTREKVTTHTTTTTSRSTETTTTTQVITKMKTFLPYGSQTQRIPFQSSISSISTISETPST
ncbi:hypothetical protein HYDPIDRAFT_29057 [Hydnomerulius pinastri MD-312]|uniref:Uncharacterized protein n=1 Tax=Hydnomerulius pinastri MD-312 TaxID=994086 RepID=A0A0C9VZ81_9AGAM|nr:hypothetical protein HYDPIDRAFT_29057 [Hydnomerulius pinastri MD-312]